MALTTSGQIPCNTPTTTPYNLRRPILPNLSSSSWSHPLNRTSRTLLIASAAKKLRTGKFDSKDRKGSTSTKEEEEEFETSGSSKTAAEETFEGYFVPPLPGDEPDFWEGPQWDGLGFFMQYMWAFGILFALISSGIAVVTYNEGATDFKETPAYKESIQSRDLLDEPEASNSDVFESNPTEEAPSLE